MYNYQQYARQALFDDECKRFKNNHVRLRDLRRSRSQIMPDNNVKMSSNHSRRVDAFTLSALENPIPVHQYKPPTYLPRKIQNNNHPSIAHSKPFRMNSHTAQERINDINMKTRYFDGVPFHNASLHKFRQLASSSQTKPIRLNASCSVVRVYEGLKKNRTNEVQVYENPKLEKIFRSTCPLNLNNRNLKTFQKGLAPTLHRKTYFNSLRTLTNLQTGRNKKIDVKKKEFDHAQDKNDHSHEKENKKINKQNVCEGSNRRKNAIQALQKCGLWKNSEK